MIEREPFADQEESARSAWQAAIEHVNRFRAEDSKCPPHPCCGEQGAVVIDDDGIAVADAERADRLAELRGARQHVRQVGGMIADRFDVEERRAGDMSASVFGVRVAVMRRKKISRVNHRKSRIAQVFSEPLGWTEPAARL